MTLKGDPKFKGNLTCGLKNDLGNLVNFTSGSRKSENLYFDRLFLSKAYNDLDAMVKRKMHWIYAFLFMSQSFTQNPKWNFLKICFPQDKMSGGNYDFLYQNSIRKYGNDLNTSLFIFCMICNFSKCDCFTVLWIKSIK